MPNKMLIDASHPEETRVVVVRGNRIEEFDFESQDKKQLRGNIYLARVTRVEPSLQAAFVEYGGNRHGFLAFSEIHPDYYQIPVADRQALLKAEAAQARAEDDDDEEEEDGNGDRNDRRGRRKRRARGRNGQSARGAEDQHQAESEGESGGSLVELDEVEIVETLGESTGSYGTEEENGAAAEAGDVSDDAGASTESDTADDDEDPAGSGRSLAASIEGDVISEPVAEATSDDSQDRGTVEEIRNSSAEEGEIESVRAEDALEEVRARRKPLRRQYKIQEVIKRRQILLVQVVKEERGNKGAAMTTYLSLAGRYSVLMPNTARGGGISRKITNAQDRKRLKDVVKDLEVPEGMGVILRTAGENRTKAEIKRDYEYLMRLWENVRNLTLQSTAPALVYEEGSLIKRSVRDLYNKDIDEILVAGDEGYREAKDFMRMLMPSHAKVVQPYRDTTPIFARNGIEAQLDKMLQPQVTLKSGGYIIINQTEALVSIDVNSGRSTKEHSIEDTALQTNLEAAEEVARQLRLRDLAGLIVIDFIDMEENRNNRAVEKRLKDHLKNDRARIQVGRISHFGLMEMSRQRIRASVLESTMKPCPHCGGTGHVRSDSSVALMVVRAIEESLLKDSRHHLIVRTPTATALYVLNHKRSTLAELERRFALTVTIEVDETLGSQHYAILRGAIAEKPADFVEPASLPAPAYEEPDLIEDEIVEEDDSELENDGKPAQRNERSDGQHAHDGEHNRDRKKRRRRRRRGGRDRDDEHRSPAEQAASDDADAVAGVDDTDGEDGSDDETSGNDVAVTAEQSATSESERKKRRRGKRGGKRNRREDGAEGADDNGADAESAEGGDLAAAPAEAISDFDAQEAVEAGSEPSTSEVDLPVETVEPVEAIAEPVAEKPKRKPRARKSDAADGVAAEKPARKLRASRKKTEAIEAAAETPAAAETFNDVSVPAEEEAVAAEQVVVETPPAEAVSSPVAPEPEAEAKPKKGGWWQRGKSFF